MHISIWSNLIRWLAVVPWTDERLSEAVSITLIGLSLTAQHLGDGIRISTERPEAQAHDQGRFRADQHVARRIRTELVTTRLSSIAWMLVVVAPIAAFSRGLKVRVLARAAAFLHRTHDPRLRRHWDEIVRKPVLA